MEHVPLPGRFPLVLDQLVDGVRLTQVRMDGGSDSESSVSTPSMGWRSLASELGRLVYPSTGSSWDTRPTHSGSSIYLSPSAPPITTGSRTCVLKFIDMLGSFHPILGCPCYAKFMKIPNYPISNSRCQTLVGSSQCDATSSMPITLVTAAKFKAIK